jgi:methyl-accepting chemotaxis protein
MKDKRKRRRYFINPGFQSRFLLIIFGSALLILAVIAGNMYMVIWNSISDGMIAQEAQNADRVFARSNQIFFLRLTVLVILLGILCVFLSHKIAGPLFRLQTILKKIKKRDISMSVRFRNNDEFKELAEEADDMVDGLNHALQEARQLLNNMESLVEKSEKDQKIISNESIRNITEQFKAFVSSFQLRK